MARKTKKTEGANGVGHNSGDDISEDERADLVAYFGSKIRAQRRKAEAKKAEYDTERDEVNALFSTARGELRWTRKRFEAVLAAQDMTEAEFLASEQERLADLRLGGLPVGEQLELKLGDTADDKAAAYNSGRRAGLRGDDPECPESVAPILRADWEHGWSDGQKELGERMIRAADAIAARQAKMPELTAGEPGDGDDEDDGDLEPEVVAEKARKLKKAGWTEPTAAEAEFATA